MEQVYINEIDMAYTANLTSNQRLTISLQGNQTNISLISSSPGQQQSQSTSFTTGSWQTSPQLYQTGMGFVIKIDGDRGTQYILIQGISNTTSVPSFSNARQVDLQDIPDPAPSQNNINIEFEPMQPMKMGNMSMDINSMSMQMGNMAMNMNKNKTAIKRFCPQCGEQVKPSDRFCSSCGHQLN